MVVAIRTPDQVTAERQQEAARIEAMRRPYENTQAANLLAAHIRSCWERAKNNKQPINARLLDCLRRRKGEYAPDHLAEIKRAGGSEVFMKITGAKCRAAKAWLSDLFNPAGDRPWTIDPTPNPDLPPDIMERLVMEAIGAVTAARADGMEIPPDLVRTVLMEHRERLLNELGEEAKTRAERMSERIEDLMIDARWRQAFEEFIDDLVTYPAAILKGIEFRRVKRLKWMTNQAGKHAPVKSDVIVPHVRRVSPFRAYPSPAAGSSLAGHWFIEHHTFTRSDLAAMRGAPGYNNEAVVSALMEYQLGGLREWIWSDTERATLEGRNLIYADSEGIDGLEWSGSLLGQTLLNWGIDLGEEIDPAEEYQISALCIGNFVVRALINPDPAGRPDYMRACWQSVPGSFWGQALPESMSDCQDACNNAARSLMMNMAYSAGPQVWVEMERLAKGADVDIYPWKVWQTSQGQQSGPGVGFFQPASNANELLMIYERFSRYADDITGLPAYAYGSDNGAGAAKTASGLSMLLNASSKTIKDVVRSIDHNVIEPLVEKFYHHVMLTDPDDTIKGDAVPHAKGSEALMHKEQQQLRMQELLGITANPIDMQITGLEGRRAMLEEVVKSGSLAPDRVVPSREELEQRLLAEQQAALAQPQKEPASEAA